MSFIRVNPFVISSLLAVLIAPMAQAASTHIENAPNVNDLMQKVVYRYEGNSNVRTLSLLSCHYQITNEKLNCLDEPRQKLLRGVEKKYGNKLEDSRALTLILKPSSEQDIGLLQYDYDDPQRDADQWLYLGSLGRIKRIANDDDGPKKGSLFGTEFSLEDIEKLKIRDYNFTIVGVETWQNRPTWKIEQVPKPDRAKKTNYSKTVHWIDQERFLVLKTDYYGWDSKHTKQSIAQQVKQIDGIWTVQKYLMRNLETQRLSLLTLESIHYNPSVDDQLLTQRSLVDKVFRQQQLQQVMHSLKLTAEAGET